MASTCWMKQVIDGKAWRGEALARETSWIMRLSDTEVADVERALATARATGKPLEAITREDFPLTVMRPRLEGALRAGERRRGAGPTPAGSARSATSAGL